MIELERRRTRHPQLIAPFLQEPGREIEVIVVGIDGESILRELFPIQTADLGILAPSSESFASIRDSLDAGSPLSLSLGHVPPGFDHGLARDFGQNDVVATSPFAMEEDSGDFEGEGLNGEGLQGGVLSCRERRVWDDDLQESVSDLPDRVTRVDRHAASVLHKRKRYVFLDLMGRRQRFV